VVERGTGKLVGILTNRDVRFADRSAPAGRELMTTRGPGHGARGRQPGRGQALLHQHKIEKLIVVDDAYRCVGLITVKDMEKAEAHPERRKDEKGRLRSARRPASATTASSAPWR
jgi:IMP dehydrogenase